MRYRKIYLIIALTTLVIGCSDKKSPQPTTENNSSTETTNQTQGVIYSQRNNENLEDFAYRIFRDDIAAELSKLSDPGEFNIECIALSKSNESTLGLSKLYLTIKPTRENCASLIKNFDKYTKYDLVVKYDGTVRFENFFEKRLISEKKISPESEVLRELKADSHSKKWVTINQFNQCVVNESPAQLVERIGSGNKTRVIENENSDTVDVIITTGITADTTVSFYKSFASCDKALMAKKASLDKYR